MNEEQTEHEFIDLVDVLCNKHGFPPTQCASDLPPGWARILDTMLKDLRVIQYQGEIAQVKEKLGTLRVYLSEMNKQADKIVAIAEAESETTCQDCGDPGQLRAGGWLRTLCDKHQEEWRQQRGYAS